MGFNSVDVRKMLDEATLIQNHRRSGPMANNYSKVTYLYRDASNYKFWSAFWVEGVLELARLTDHMVDGEFFVPEKVGLKRLVPTKMNLDDHELHEIESVEFVTDCADSIFTKSDELIQRFRSIGRDGWFA